MKTKNKIYLILAFVVICILAFVFMLAKIVKDNSACISSPFTYAANTIVDNKGEVIYSLCSCSVGQDKFYFDKEGIYKEDPYLKNYLP